MKLRTMFIVDKQFQYSFILKNLILLVFSFVLVFLAIRVWEQNQVKQGFLIRPPKNIEVMEWAKANNIKPDSAEYARRFIEAGTVYTVFSLIWKPIVTVLVLNIIILVLASIYYSHRIAGPIYRLKKLLEEKIKGGHIEPVYFRKNDEFQELAELINKVLSLERKQ